MIIILFYLLSILFFRLIMNREDYSNELKVFLGSTGLYASKYAGVVPLPYCASKVLLTITQRDGNFIIYIYLFSFHQC